MIVLETERLILRHLRVDDDLEFVVRLLNEPSFLRYIGDKGVRTLDDARQYLLNGPIASYEKNGYGLYLVQLKDSGSAIGICGLVKRDYLEHADIGFAMLPDFWRKGYAFEASTGVIKYARETLNLDHVVAIIEPSNEASARLLEKLGLTFERTLDVANGPVKLFTPAGNEMFDKL